MIAVDTNILVYAHRQDSPWHRRAAETLTALAEGPEPWAIPWPCIHEFLSITTHPRIYKPPTPPAKAIADLQAWFESPSVSLISETDLYWEILEQTVRTSGAVGPLVHDARIAAICRAHGVTTLLSADRDFSRFGIRIRNPLKAG
jgi:toxin-antitoxin system PIN domain toxin